jgi:glyoxylase-like metal-dependent hydrolase (beta-lactamase superfamily II)
MKLKEGGASVSIGRQEREMLEPAGLQPPFQLPAHFLLNGELPDWGRRMAPFHKTGVDQVFDDGASIVWNQYHIRVINTPGHTGGSISYFVETGGRRIAFTGDLIVQGGHIRDLYSMQWSYLENPGIDSSLASLKKVSRLSPDLILPSHGEIVSDPAQDIRMLEIRLKQVQLTLAFERAGRWNWSGFVQVSPHVIQDCGTTTQIIKSEDGEALLFDCGDDFTISQLAEVKRMFGIRNIAVIVPSHWHFDHVNGIPGIVKSEGAKVWVYEGLSEHLEYPEHFPTTCWSGITIKPDRVLHEGEEFEWGGHSFRVYPNPAHMEEQMALYARVDSLRFLFMGDGTSSNSEGHLRSVIHGYNGISLNTGLIITAKSVYDANPYICVPAHSNAFATQENTRDEYMAWAVNATDAITALLKPDLPETGYNPYWASFYPARIKVEPGEEATMALRLKNPEKSMARASIRLKGYGDFKVEAGTSKFVLKPGEVKDIPFVIQCNNKAAAGLHIVTADIMINDECFSELPQGYIEIRD